MLYILSRKKALCLIEEYVVVFYDLYLKNLSNKDQLHSNNTCLSFMMLL